MPKLKPCDDGYADELAREYLRTIGGNTTEDPYGWACIPSDVDEWRMSIVRIRTAMSDAIVQNKGIELSEGVTQRIATWVFESLKVPRGKFFPHAAPRWCREDVGKAIDFGKRGVSLLGDVLCEIQKKDGKIPDTPGTKPAPKELPYGQGIWFMFGAIAILGLVAYIKPKA